MQQQSTSITALFGGLWRHRELIRVLLVREVASRYRGSFLGLIWSFVIPLTLLGVYTFVFSVVFQARWGLGSESRYEFALVLFAGLIVFNLFAECVSRAPGLIISNVNYVQKVVFPLEILPWVALGGALFNAGVSLVILLLALALSANGVVWTSLFVPLVLFPLVLLIAGLSWILASLGVFIRDIGQFIGVVVTLTLFMSPIFYPASALPPGIEPWLLLNPLTFIIEQLRSVIIWGHQPHWGGLLLYALIALAVAWAGFFWFQKSRKGFADVL